MSFNISQVTNSKAEAVPVKGLGLRQIHKSRFGVLTPEEEIVIVDTASSTVLDELIWSTNRDSVFRVRISAYVDGSESIIADIVNDGSGIFGFYPLRIIRDSSGFFDVLEYDTSNNRFKFKLKRPLTFAEGFKLSVNNISTAGDAQYGIVILGREYD